jgi:2-dehydropantoate 2-reductase
VKVIVVGAGAMGAIFGAGMTKGGLDVALLDVDPELVSHIGERGLMIDTPGGKERVAIDAATKVEAGTRADLVLMCVKCYHTRAAAELVSPAVGPETVVASLQNGWGNGDVLAEFFAPDRLVVGVTYNSGTIIERGIVAHTGRGATIVGPYEGVEVNWARRVEQALGAGGFEAGTDPRIRQEIWKKLILNAATLPTAAATGLTAGQLGRPGPMLELVDTVTREAAAVAAASGFDIDAEERIAVIHELLPKVGDGKASMLQDIEAGRRTEIEVITGAVVAAAEVNGTPVPANRTLYAIINALDDHRS